MNGIVRIPTPVNEPVRDYAPGSPERESLQSALSDMLSVKAEIPVLIGGQEVFTGDTAEVVCPHDHGHVLAEAHMASGAHVKEAIEAAATAWNDWSEMPWESRAAVLLKAGELAAGPWRDRLNAATMLGQSKTVLQAEVDSACEVADFFRFNPWLAERIYAQQPISSPGMWNRIEHRPLEGFVFAVAPFNFTAIGANLPTAPALMGNTVLLKPATTSILSNYVVMQLLREAGLPDGVINFVPGRGAEVGDPAFASPELAGLHFTGSTGTFQHMWRTIGENLPNYRSYPRIVGETGGKDFVFAHPSASVEEVATALVRGAFEYQGQKCSAASRAYIPKSMWPELRERLADTVGSLPMGDVTDFSNFMAAVIDKASFDNIADYLETARESASMEILVGGNCDDSKGYFVEPTVVVSSDPGSRLMCEEIFGPVLTIHPYDDDAFEETLAICDRTSPYALTGGIFARDRGVIDRMAAALRHAAGNFYVNDKPTGAVVGQQPFGGGRASGTNDKAGSVLNLQRWVSPRTIKETFVPPTDHRYPHMDSD